MRSCPRHVKKMKKIPTLDEILTQPGARESYGRLIGLGLGEEQLADQLSLLLYIPSEMPDLVPRRSDRRTKLLPDRIKNMADEIQQVNDSSGLLYEMALESFVEKRRTLRNTTKVGITQDTRQGVDYCRSLPLMLRTYAEYLRYAIKKNRKGWSELHNYAIYCFQSKIKNATGSYHDKHVALLLSAAFRAAGDDRAADRFNENQLKALRQTGKKLYSPQKHSG